MSDWSEKRAEPRISTTGLDLRLVNADDDTPLGTLANVSRSGLMVNAPQPLTEGTSHQVELLWHDAAGAQRIPLGIHVLWCTGGPAGSHWAGCEIIAISDEHREQLDALIVATG